MGELRVFIAGIDGYLGHALAQYLMSRGHYVSGCDCHHRREWVKSEGGDTAIPIGTPGERHHYFKERFGKLWVGSYNINIAHEDNYGKLAGKFADLKPHAVVHLAEMPSAPFSMISREHAAMTHMNNVVGSLNVIYAIRGSCPDAHLVKLGTMGEYGTPPGTIIPEGVFPEGSHWDIEMPIVQGGQETGTQYSKSYVLDGLMFPRQAGSWYHQTKVHDTNNVNFACRMWGLRSTDIMQGVVYGTRIKEMDENPMSATRFDFDECFGTAINRFCSQATIGMPLTVYGNGTQKRGFLPLCDSMQCLAIAIEQPPAEGEYRVWNQFEEVYSIRALAQAVASSASVPVEIENVPNPRKEAEGHMYEAEHSTLLKMGYVPTNDLSGQIVGILEDLEPHADRIRRYADTIMPQITWDGGEYDEKVDPVAGNGAEVEDKTEFHI